MSNQQLIDYIKQNLEKGVDREEIKKVLLKAGLSEQDINEAIQSLDNTAVTSAFQTDNYKIINRQSKNKFKIFLVAAIFTVLLLIIGGGIYYYQINKQIKLDSIKKDINLEKETKFERNVLLTKVDAEKILKNFVPEIPDIKLANIEVNKDIVAQYKNFIQGDFNKDGVEDIAISGESQTDYKTYILIATKNENNNWSRVFFKEAGAGLIWDEKFGVLYGIILGSDTSYNDVILWDYDKKQFIESESEEQAVMSEEADAKNYKTYINKELGIKISYPNKWFFEENIKISPKWVDENFNPERYFVIKRNGYDYANIYIFITKDKRIFDYFKGYGGKFIGDKIIHKEKYKEVEMLEQQYPPNKIYFIEKNKKYYLFETYFYDLSLFNLIMENIEFIN